MCPPASFCHACAYPYAVVYVPTHILVNVPTCILLLCVCLSIYLWMCPHVSFCCVCVHPHTCVCAHLYPSVVYVSIDVLVYVPTCILLLFMSVHILVNVPTCILLLCICMSIYLWMCPHVSFCCVCVHPYTCVCAHLYPSVVYVSIHILLLCIFCLTWFPPVPQSLHTFTSSDCSMSVVKSCLYHGSYFLCCLFLIIFMSFIVFILISVPYVKREIICSVIGRSSEWIHHEVTW